MKMYGKRSYHGLWEVDKGTEIGPCMGLLNSTGPKVTSPLERSTTGREKDCSKKHALRHSEGFNQSCPETVEGKATVLLTRGVYLEYVSTAKGRERRWLVCRSLCRRLAAFFNIPYIAEKLLES